MIHSIENLVKDFSTVFSEEQSKMLAKIIHNSYNDIVKVSDFTDLKSVVQDLGNAQKATQIELKELAYAQKQTEIRVEELAEAQKRTEIKVEELAEAQKRTEIKVEELADNLSGLQKEVKNLAKQVGGLSEAFGGSLEDFALDFVPELVEKYWNVEVKEVSREEILIDNKKIEFDIYIEGLIENYPAIILGEVKSNITIDEVDKFYKKVEIAKTYYNVSDIRVIFFGYRAYREVREYIRSKGGAMLFTNGKTF